MAVGAVLASTIGLVTDRVSHALHNIAQTDRRIGDEAQAIIAGILLQQHRVPLQLAIGPHLLPQRRDS